MMNKKILSAFAALIFAAGCSTCDTGKETGPAVRFAALADIQYADQPENIGRFYVRSNELAKESVKIMNVAEVEFVINLGDLIDRDEKSFEAPLATLAKLKMPLYNVAGNHDFLVPDADKRKVFDILGMPAPYYVKQAGNWDFIFLDTNTVTAYAYPQGTPEHGSYKKLIAEKYSFVKPWDGGLGLEQLDWLAARLDDARNAGRKAVLCFHVPAHDDPVKEEGMVDSPEFLELVSGYADTVKLVLSGHEHRGGHKERSGIHFLTLKGQVEADLPTFCIIELNGDTISVQGFGRQESFDWSF